MKKTILVLLIIINASCRKENDTALECLSDCTVVQGRLVTAKGEPLENIPIEFRHNLGVVIGSSIRRIKKTTTDKNGFYQLKFFIENDELGANAEGFFQLIIDYSSLDSEIFMVADPFYDTSIYSLDRRDTTITMDFYNPKKAYITVNLNGFNPSTEDDYFEIRSLYPVGLKIGENEYINSEYQLGYDGNESYANSFNTKVDSVLVAESDFNLISLSKRKNGGEVIDEYHEIFVTENSNEEYNYDY